MSMRLWRASAGVCVLTMSTLCGVSSVAQTSEVKEKPALYTYIANWQIPRAHWVEMEKENAADNAILAKALADGTVVGYGSDEYLVHDAEGETHDNWWSAMSMAGLIKALNQLDAPGGNDTSPVLVSATKHWDEILVSRYYNWHSGAFKDGYLRVSDYKLKPDAPSDAVDTLSKQMVAPLLEKLVADGTIREYEIDVQAIHTDAPGNFAIVYVASSPEGLDKVDAAIVDALKASPLSGTAFTSMIDFSAHRDELAKAQGVYK